MQKTADDYVIVIPSLNPDPELIDLLQSLRRLCNNPILVVNDGSRADCLAVFNKLTEIENCEVITQHVNLGKGRALKTAFNHCLNKYPHIQGVVTADADGQHRPEDIVKCLEVMQQNSGKLVLGCRDFDAENVPWKSSFGNKLTRGFFRCALRLNISDTQTGLRGIPAGYMKILMNKFGERFEFETIMLLESSNAYNSQTFPITEYTIATVYIDNNRETHFRPIVDSLKIYRIIFKYLFQKIFLFFISGMLSAALDQGLFAWLFYKVLPLLKLPPLILAVVLARCVSLLFNYTINRNVVFGGQKSFFDAKTFCRYLALCAVIMFSSYGLLKLSHALLPGVNMVIKKIIIDCCLFIVSYKVQQKMIFGCKISDCDDK